MAALGLLTGGLLILLSRKRRALMNRALQLIVLISGVAASAFAGSVISPEIDASSGMAAAGLLTGGLLILRSRKKKS
jgi:hypothetical protein